MLNDMHARAMQADREREMNERIRNRQYRLERPSVRRVVGRSIMAIGARVAAEPQPRLARSR